MCFSAEVSFGVAAILLPAGVYDVRGCGACHMVAGKGGSFGPELTDIGARRNAAWLRQTILQPASSLGEDFVYVSR